MRNSDKVIKDAVKEAGREIAEYLRPGERDCEETIEKLITTLDNNEVTEAILESDEKEKRNGRRSETESPARRQPYQH